MNECLQAVTFYVIIIFVILFVAPYLVSICKKSWSDIIADATRRLNFLNIKRAGYAFKTSIKDDLDYRSANILDIDSGKGIYRNYIPQGFSMTKDYIYFSAYHKFETCKKVSGYDETKPSRVFKIDRKNGKLVNIYTLTTLGVGAHVGGLAVIDGTNQFFVADGTSIAQYKMPTNNDKKDVVMAPSAIYPQSLLCLGGENVSYLYWDASRSLLWMGNWAEKSHTNVCALQVIINKDDVSLGKKAIFTSKLPVNSVQGIAVKPNSKDSGAKNPDIYLSKSYSSSDSIIYRWQPGKNKTKVDRVAEGWRGLQNMDFDKDGKNVNLWGITEAGSKYYQNRKVVCGLEPPWPKHPGYIYADIDVYDNPWQ